MGEADVRVAVGDVVAVLREAGRSEGTIRRHQVVLDRLAAFLAGPGLVTACDQVCVDFIASQTGTRLGALREQVRDRDVQAVRRPVVLMADALAGRAVVTGGPPLPWTVTTLGSLGTGGTPMVTKYQKFGDGYKAEAVKLYRESNQTIAETARNLGLKESTLANWVKKDKDNEAVAVGEAPLTPAERTRIRELEADVRRLNMENAFLKKASAYFASQNL